MYKRHWNLDMIEAPPCLHSLDIMHQQLRIDNCVFTPTTESTCWSAVSKAAGANASSPWKPTASESIPVFSTPIEWNESCLNHSKLPRVLPCAYRPTTSRPCLRRAGRGRHFQYRLQCCNPVHQASACRRPCRPCNGIRTKRAPHRPFKPHLDAVRQDPFASYRGTRENFHLAAVE